MDLLYPDCENAGVGSDVPSSTQVLSPLESLPSEIRQQICKEYQELVNVKPQVRFKVDASSQVKTRFVFADDTETLNDGSHTLIQGKPQYIDGITRVSKTLRQEFISFIVRGQALIIACEDKSHRLQGGLPFFDPLHYVPKQVSQQIQSIEERCPSRLFHVQSNDFHQGMPALREVQLYRCLFTQPHLPSPLLYTRVTQLFLSESPAFFEQVIIDTKVAFSKYRQATPFLLERKVDIVHNFDSYPFRITPSNAAEIHESGSTPSKVSEEDRKDDKLNTKATVLDRKYRQGMTVVSVNPVRFLS